MTQVDILTQNGVYKITNTINGKIYIGSASCQGGFSQRWKGRYNKYLTNAFKKYGKHNFKFEILQICGPIYCLAYEQEYLHYYKPWLESGVGYNIAKQAVSRISSTSPMYGRKHTAETKLKMSKRRSNVVFNSMTISKMSMAKLGRTLTQSHRSNISAAHKGKRLPSEVRAKISNSHLKTPIERIDIKTGEVKEYPSQASIVLEGFNQGNVFLCLVGKKKTSKGYFWKYMEESDDTGRND